jgi:catechol 2,3-dioxygenase-like lactoylglutathione lyase family enzyme
MKLEFMYLPTQDLAASLALYRDTLGFDELWREGDETVGLAVPGTDVALMIDAAPQPEWGPGPIFVVPDAAAFHAQHDGAYELTVPPFEIPGGLMSMFKDAGGNPVYVMDQSREAVG